MKPELKKFKVGLWLSLTLLSSTLMAQSVRLDGGKLLSQEEPVVASLRCQGIDVQFAKGVRWTPADFSAEVSVVGPRGGTTTLGPSCHRDMTCISADGQPAVLIVDAPACGGNAVPEEYIVIQLKSMKKKVYSYAQARKMGLAR